jgi:oligopeptidase B
MSLEAQQAVNPPTATKKPKQLEKHGHTRTDNYYWLNERENPEVISYLEAENDYWKAKMKHTEAFQEKLFAEMKGRIKETDVSVPYNLDGFSYYNRYEEGQQYPVYCRRKINTEAEASLGKEEVMIDVNEMAKGHDFCQVYGLSVSNNNRVVGFFIDTVGRRKYTLQFKDLETGKMLADKILDTDGFAWANDNKTVFYVKKDPVTLRECKVYKHVLGYDPAEDELIFHDTDESMYVGIGRTKSKQFIIIASGGTISSEWRYLDADNPNGQFKVFLPKERDHLYSIDHFEDKFYIRTNRNAKNFKMMETSISNTAEANWKEVIPHRTDVLFEDFEVFKDFLVIQERIKGLTALRIRPWKDSKEHYLDFGEPTYTAYTSVNPEFDTKILRYTYTSMTTPNSTYDYNMVSKEKKLLKQQEVLGGYNPADYVTERLWAAAKDGTKVPISLVYKKGLKKDGKAPMLLYSYGSYGISSNATFSSTRLSLLNRGFVFAMAHIRGGQEMGREWYENGKLLKKKNTFTDFIDCADFLIKQKYAAKDKIFAQGGSAGGLLMGAVTNMRPELWKGIIAQVPFVDVITTMSDTSIPLTTNEFDEWGNPANKEYYDYMLSYSPYDQVDKKAYPNILVTTGLHDSQVQYFEPAKWVAKLREMKTDNNTLMLKTDMSAGHGGKSGRFDALKDVAFVYAFMFDLIGIKE